MKCLAFDFDGVLVNSLPYIIQYATEVTSDMGHVCNPQPEDVDALDPMEFESLALQLGLEPRKVDQFTRKIIQKFNSRKEPLPLFDGIRNVLAQLYDSYPLAIVSGNSEITVKSFLQHHNLSHFFAQVAGKETEGTKSDKLKFLAKRFNLSPAQVFLIGDAKSDIRAARDAGAFSVAVAWGNQSLNKLMREAPHFVAQDPDDLLSFFLPHPR